jgi:alanine dehydrogenase
MKIGIPKGIRNQEQRVLVDPSSLKNLISRGNKVLIQQDAGIGVLLGGVPGSSRCSLNEV